VLDAPTARTGAVLDGAHAAPAVRGHGPAVRLTLVALTVAALWAAATLLADASHRQRSLQSRRAAANGLEHLARRAPDAAAEQFREAVALDPDEPAYRLNLARALLALDRVAEAEFYLRDVLAAEPVHGEANLELARLERRRQHHEAAERAYYRAIYGRWQSGQQPQRIEARLELVALFAEIGDPGRTRTALNDLAEGFPGDLTLQQHAARQLLALGFAQDAVRVLRATVGRFAEPGHATTLLAEAELARDDARAALSAARRALADRPNDPRALEVRALAERLLALDPGGPRLGTQARITRIRTLIVEARARLSACRPATPAPTAVALAEAWRKTRRGRAADRLAEGYSTLEELAALVQGACPADRGDAVDLLLRRIAREAR
jgi:predicted Zn-dependent protease